MNRDYWESMRERPMMHRVIERAETRDEPAQGSEIEKQSLDNCFGCDRFSCKECENLK